MAALEMYFPHWRGSVVHESSPSPRAARHRLARETKYIASQYFPDGVPGTLYDGVRCENIERLTFDNESIDFHVSQDVFEHVLNPDAAFREIARTLKPGGAHVFTTPLVRKHKPSEMRVDVQNGEIVHVKEPQYHGNPIDRKGSLVTIDWGYDICEHIHRASGLFTHLVYIDDLSRGIRAELIEVLITIKPATANPA